MVFSTLHTNDAPGAVRHADSIARRGRAVAVSLVAATQRPTQKAMGQGAVRSQMDGGPAVIYTMGQTWFEAPGAIHAFAENASATEPAELLAIFVAEDDCGPLTIPVPD